MGSKFDLDYPASVTIRYESGEIIPLGITPNKKAQPICNSCSEKQYNPENTLQPRRLTPGPVSAKEAFKVVQNHLEGRDLYANGEIPDKQKLSERSFHLIDIFYKESPNR